MGKITVLKGRVKIKICPRLSHGMIHSSSHPCLVLGLCHRVIIPRVRDHSHQDTTTVVLTITGHEHSIRTDLLHHILPLVLTELNLLIGTSHSSELTLQEETRTLESEIHHLPDLLVDFRVLVIFNNELLVLTADNLMRRLETKS